jgi:hypothetical protein
VNAVSETVEDLFDLELELVDEPASSHERCLHTAYQSTCGGVGCLLQA